MKILMSGYQGYIGAVMVPMLTRAGHQVVGLDCGYFEGCDFGPYKESIDSIQIDVRDVAPKHFDGFDAVIHLAALSNDPMGEINPDLTYEINHQGSVRLAQAAREVGVKRFLFSSSCSMYGAAGEEMLTEASPFNPVSAYARSKVSAEADIRGLANDNFSPVFLRNSTAYGVSPRLRVDVVLNNLTAWAFTTGKVKILSDGTPWRPLVHVEDISAAFLAILEAPQETIHNEAFNVGVNTDNYQVRQLADIVKDVVPGCVVEYAGQGEPDSRNYRVDFSKLATRIPGFQPKWNARKGVEQLYEAFRSIGLTLEDFQSKNYIRLKQLKHLLKWQRLDVTLRWKKDYAVDLEDEDDFL